MELTLDYTTNFDEYILPYDYFNLDDPAENIKRIDNCQFDSPTAALIDIKFNQTRFAVYKEKLRIVYLDTGKRSSFIPRSGDFILGFELHVQSNSASPPPPFIKFHFVGNGTNLVTFVSHKTNSDKSSDGKTNIKYMCSLHYEPFMLFSLVFTDLQIYFCEGEYTIKEFNMYAGIIEPSPMCKVSNRWDRRYRFVWNGKAFAGGMPHGDTIPFSKILKKTDSKGKKYYKRLFKMRGIDLNLQLLVVCQHFDQLLTLSKKLPFLKDFLGSVLGHKPDFIREI